VKWIKLTKGGTSGPFGDGNEDYDSVTEKEKFHAAILRLWEEITNLILSVASCEAFNGADV
jgi:hypothetical protein